MPPIRASPCGSAAAASVIPATVSWSVSAKASSPAAAARATTSAGGLVPSEAELWQCRSARTTTIWPTLADFPRQPRGPRAERQIEFLAGIAQIEQPQPLPEKRASQTRPDHDPEPQAHDIAGQHGPVR